PRQTMTSHLAGGDEARIGPHRTLMTLRLSRADVLGAAALSAVFVAAAWLVAPYLFATWRWAFERGSAALGLGGATELVPSALLSTSIPVLALNAAVPGRTALIA